MNQQFFLNRARSYCNYQERCFKEVTDKLREWSVQPKVAVKIIKQLEEEDTLNEERYARSFALGKFHQLNWGKAKIIKALQEKEVPDLLIQMGLLEINDAEYRKTLLQLLRNKSLKTKDPYIRNHKLARYAIQKGYAPNLVWDVIHEDL